jgi:hypothetical protein
MLSVSPLGFPEVEKERRESKMSAPSHADVQMHALCAELGVSADLLDLPPAFARGDCRIRGEGCDTPGFPDFNSKLLKVRGPNGPELCSLTRLPMGASFAATRAR